MDDLIQKNKKKDLGRMHGAIILLRRLTRLILKLSSLEQQLDFFLGDILYTNVNICVDNYLSQSDDYLKFSFTSKGSISQKENGQEDFRIIGQILDTSVANLTFYDPNHYA